MGRSNRYLSAEAREYIVWRMRESGEMSRKELMDLIRPHFKLDPEDAREQALGRYANQLVSRLRDKQGIRTSFTLQGQDIIINIERSKDLENVRAVKEQLLKQIRGTAASCRKARRREKELEGQLSVFAESKGA